MLRLSKVLQIYSSCPSENGNARGDLPDGVAAFTPMPWRISAIR